MDASLKFQAMRLRDEDQDTIADLTAEMGEIRSEIDIARHQAIACVRKAEEDAQLAEFEYQSLEKYNADEVAKIHKNHMEVLIQSQTEQAKALAQEKQRADHLAEQLKRMNEELDRAADESAENEKVSNMETESQIQLLKEQHETDLAKLADMKKQLAEVTPALLYC